MLKYLANLLKVLWEFLQPKPVPEEVLPPVLDPDLQPIIHPIEKPMNNAEKFYKVCVDALDTDVTPKDEIPDEVACAQVLTTLLKKVLPDFPILESTKELDLKLFMDKRFERVTDGKKGDIIISPRTPQTTGHVGVYITDERIASNDSKTGKFVGNYDFQKWVNYFKVKKGLRIFIYKFKQ